MIGELKYPDKSLMPKINGAMDFVRQRIIPKLRQGRSFRQPANTMQLSVVDNKPRSAVYVFYVSVIFLSLCISYFS
ncbi:hypothetical protein AVEN_237065-1 [Araneus ventricosus]|uniref:Uncharacterized protein n=1 Tax=Araneus ventricosus TaxID=182803 RepID=A0A4Y2J4U4_ARAVE|nr:hypothetical protein AVEN_237065-1 [Araneus ventricosus]